MKLEADIIADLRARDLIATATDIAKAHQVTLWELVSRDRHRAPSRARQALWAALYELGHWSYPRLGQLFDRDHATVLDGIQAHRRRTSPVPIPPKTLARRAPRSAA